MKVWITKYALTTGIVEVNGEVWKNDYIDVPRYNSLFSKNEWHTNIESAKAKAEQMRQAKIASLKKQIAKLEKLEF